MRLSLSSFTSLCQRYFLWPRRLSLLHVALLCGGLARFDAEAWGAPAFALKTAHLRDGDTVPGACVNRRYGCHGLNRSPALSWRNPPTGTHRFAITIFDPDAPGPGWWHWAVVGIPANVTHLPAGASGSALLKAMGAVEARNDFGDEGYGGPCPPPGRAHRYIITVYALKDIDLSVRSGGPAPMFGHEIDLATLASAKIELHYGR